MWKNRTHGLLLITLLFTIVAVLFPYDSLANTIDIRDSITNPDFLNPNPSESPTQPSPPGQPSPSAGGEPPSVGGQEPSGGLLNGEKYQQYIQNEKNKPSYGERFISGNLISFANWIIDAMGMTDPITLVFGWAPNPKDESKLIDIRDQSTLGIFPEALFDHISYLYGLIEKLLPIPLVVSLTLVGLIVMTQSGSQEGRSKIKDYSLAFVVTLVSLRFGYYLWITVIDINYFFTDYIWAALQEKGIKTGLFLDMLWGNGSGYQNFVSFQGIGNAVIVVVAAISIGVINYQYAMRMIILSISILSFPIATTLSIFPKFRHSLQIWWQEFLGNVFVQVAHAFAYGLFFLIVSSNGEGDLSFWVIVAYFFGMPTIVVYFRQLMGMQHGNGALGAMSSMMGVAALMSMGRMFMGNKGGKVKEGNQEISDSISSSGGEGSTPTAPLLNSLSSGNRLLNNKWVKGTMMASGATAGALLSTMATGNPMMGALAGMRAVNAISGVAGQVGNMMSSAKDFASDVWDGASTTVSETNKEDDFYQPHFEQKSLGDVLESRYMSGQGGAIGNSAVRLGWGAQRFAHMVSGGRIGGDAVAKQKYISDQQGLYQSSMQGMKQIQPELNLAKEQLTQSKATYGPGSQWYRENMYENEQGKMVAPPKHQSIVQAEEKVNQLQSQYSEHKVNAMEATLNLSNHQRMMDAIQPLKQQSSFSSNRGGL